MHAHMEADPLIGILKVDQLEWQDRSGDDALKWDAIGWLGHDMNRAWLRDEGEQVSGSTAENRLELLWGQPVAAWWDLVAGGRATPVPGPRAAMPPSACRVSRRSGFTSRLRLISARAGRWAAAPGRLRLAHHQPGDFVGARGGRCVERRR